MRFICPPAYDAVCSGPVHAEVLPLGNRPCEGFSLPQMIKKPDAGKIQLFLDPGVSVVPGTLKTEPINKHVDRQGCTHLKGPHQDIPNDCCQALSSSMVF